MNNLRLIFASLAAAISQTALAQTVVEYVNQLDFPRAPNGQYFYTADPGEQAYVDSGAAGQFKRTGAQFPLGGADAVCRFYGSVTPGPNSHFYTVLPDECDSLKALQKTPRPNDVQQWNYEGSPLRASKPIQAADGTKSCAVGTKPVYRAYNNAFSAGGFKNSWDSNHRYSMRLADIKFLENLGWKSDGITMCVPDGADQAALPTAASVADQCVSPRADAKYGDKQGTLENEKSWVRSFVDERYLWTEDSPRLALEEATSAVSLYTKKLNPFTTPAGGKQDRFSAQSNTAAFETSQAGTVGGYGWSLAALSNSPPRNYTVRYVEPNGPAALAGIVRGMRIMTIDGQDFVSGGDTTALNNGLSPQLNTAHRFTLQSPDGSLIDVNLIAANVARDAANVVKTLDTPSGKVGYLHFTTFNTYPSEGQMIGAFDKFAADGVKELVLDLRYNGGGFIYVSAQMAYMIAGPESVGKTYYQFTYNSKRIAETNNPGNRWTFRNTASGFANTNTTQGAPLPTLNLKRVFVLTGTGTASASEGVINGLKGIGVDVVLIGTTTVGKPYGSLPTDNCGTTYSMLEFKGTNDQGYGDFADGFAPNCTVADDLNRQLGDPAEGRLAAALSYLAAGKCPAGTAATEVAKRSERLVDAASADADTHLMTGSFDLPPALRTRYLANEPGSLGKSK